jgi:ADP-ribose pyrophosphatase YjhB (NUDIX family)
MNNIAVSWILINNQKILLIKRWDWVKIQPGMWFVPGWKWINNETPEEIIIREVKEELNLNFQPTKCVQNIEDYGYDVYKYLWTFSWTVVIQEDELDWYWWFTYTEAKKLNLAFDMEVVLEMLHDDNLI